MPVPDIPERALRAHRGRNDVQRQKAILSYDWSGRVLEVGSGRGWISCLVCAVHDSKLIAGVELSFKLAEVSRRLAAANAANTFTPIQATGSALPFVSGSIDRLLATEVLEHVNEPLPILRECSRVLSGNGRALLTVPSFGALPPGGPVSGHVQDFTVDALRDLIRRAGLTVVEHRTVAIFEFYLVRAA